MDKQTTIGFVLISFVLILWMWFTAPKPVQEPTSRKTTARPQDSVKKQIAPEKIGTKETAPMSAIHPSDTLGKHFEQAVAGKEKFVTIETDLYTAVISSRGALIKKWELKEYKTWDAYPVNLIGNTTDGDFSLLFNTEDGKVINTRGLFFDMQIPSGGVVKLSGTDEFTLDAVLRADTGSIVKSFTFKNGDYRFDATINFRNMGKIVRDYQYQLIWEHGIRFTEWNSVDEAASAKAFSYAGGELTEVDAAAVGENPVSNTSGQTEWVATHTKYFAVAMIAEKSKSEGAYIEGTHKATENKGAIESYSIALKMPFKNSAEEKSVVTVFLGPLEYGVIKSYGHDLDNILSMGWRWLRPLNNYFFIPLFRFLHSFIENFGLVIIIFSILIRVVLQPLNASSMKAMKKMQALQPLMEEIKTKYKDDPTKMNQQVMQLYKDYGVNPAGGCLPMLIQMPILYALYTLFTASIELRQAPFIGWITDLSLPDSILTLPFTIPLIGIHFISGLALLMGITMFIQQKMTVTDPRQKAMVWMMPVMLTILFNSLPSGLNLYYFVFNLLAITQQFIVNKKQGDVKLEKVSPKKRQGGIMNALTKNLPKMPKR